YEICAYKNYLTEGNIIELCGDGVQNSIEAIESIDQILANVGLFRNFTIKQCSGISNAAAATIILPAGSMKRYILYDKDFLDLATKTTGTSWSAISILAHEIGHHLNGHNLIDGIENHD